jgi:hypothetical protein
MRFKPAALTALFAALALSALSIPSAARAGVVLGNLGADGSGPIADFGQGVGSNSQFAYGFTTGPTIWDRKLDGVVFGLIDQDGATITANLFTDNAGNPGTLVTLIGTGTATSSGTKVQFGPASPITLDLNTTYWITLSTPGAFTWAEADPAVVPTSQNGSGWLHFGSLRKSGTNPWVVITSDKAVSLSAVPEPSTYALAGIGLAAAGFARRLRKARRVTS